MRNNSAIKDNAMKLINRLIIATAIILTTTSFAADNEDGSTKSSQETDVKTADKSNKKKAEATKNEADFVPSEEISEDLPVAFPVDI